MTLTTNFPALTEPGLEWPSSRHLTAHIPAPGFYRTDLHILKPIKSLDYLHKELIRLRVRALQVHLHGLRNSHPMFLDPNVDDLSGSGVIDNEGTRDFTLTGGFHLNANGTATLFWTGTDPVTGPSAGLLKPSYYSRREITESFFGAVSHRTSRTLLTVVPRSITHSAETTRVTLPDQNNNYSLSPAVTAALGSKPNIYRWHRRMTLLAIWTRLSDTELTILLFQRPATVNITITGDGNSKY